MTVDERSELQDEIRQLEAQLAEANARLPAHSIRPHHLMEVEELEERLAALVTRLKALEG